MIYNQLFLELKDVAYQLVDLSLFNLKLTNNEKLSVVLKSLKNKHK